MLGVLGKILGTLCLGECLASIADCLADLGKFLGEYIERSCKDLVGFGEVLLPFLDHYSGEFWGKSLTVFGES